MSERACPACGVSIEGTDVRRKYCSRLCGTRTADRKRVAKRESRPCAVCGDPFIAHAHTKVCSKRACINKAISRAQVGKKNWNWKGVKDSRQAWDESLKAACALCGGSSMRLDNHHIIYRQHVRKRGGEEFDPRNAMTLCRSCHSRQHGGTSFRISVRDLPAEFFSFGSDLLGEYLWDYLARYYDDGNIGLEDLLTNAP